MDDIKEHTGFGWKFAVFSYVGLAAFTAVCSTFLLWTNSEQSAVSVVLIGGCLIFFRTAWKNMRSARDRYEDENAGLRKENEGLIKNSECLMRKAAEYERLAISRSKALSSLCNHFVRKGDDKAAAFFKVLTQTYTHLPSNIEALGEQCGEEISHRLASALAEALEELKNSDVEALEIPMNSERAIGEPIVPDNT